MPSTAPTTYPWVIAIDRNSLTVPPTCLQVTASLEPAAAIWAVAFAALSAAHMIVYFAARRALVDERAYP